MFTYSTVPVDVMADSVSHLCRGWVEGGLMVILNIFRAITVINSVADPKRFDSDPDPA